MADKIDYDYAPLDRRTPPAPENCSGCGEEVSAPLGFASGIDQATVRQGVTFRAPLDPNMVKPAEGQINHAPFNQRVHQRLDHYDQGNPDEVDWDSLYPRAVQPGRASPPTRIVGMQPAVVIRRR